MELTQITIDLTGGHGGITVDRVPVAKINSKTLRLDLGNGYYTRFPVAKLGQMEMGRGYITGAIIVPGSDAMDSKELRRDMSFLRMAMCMEAELRKELRRQVCVLDNVGKILEDVNG